MMGTWTVQGSPMPYNMAVVLRGDGTARIVAGFEGSDTASAPYVTEDHFSYGNGEAKFQFRQSADTYAYVGKAHGNKMSGTWGELPSYDDGGNWSMARVR